MGLRTTSINTAASHPIQRAISSGKPNEIKATTRPQKANDKC